MKIEFDFTNVPQEDIDRLTEEFNSTIAYIASGSGERLKEWHKPIRTKLKEVGINHKNTSYTCWEYGQHGWTIAFPYTLDHTDFKKFINLIINSMNLTNGQIILLLRLSDGLSRESVDNDTIDQMKELAKHELIRKGDVNFPLDKDYELTSLGQQLVQQIRFTANRGVFDVSKMEIPDLNNPRKYKRNKKSK